ncbi:MAG: peptidyl-prolyl cis-trans isomerase cyclophilin type [Chthoniobacteraceae bacterium]|nr:peptidyl-prolyl cis-trans isomerase cyclophilin type [Chthoniobacteraceae bacterium]
MKKIVLTLTALCAATALLHADDVALMTLRVGKEKQVQRVAMEFYNGDAPAHVENFKKLAKEKFYNGQAIHRSFPHLLIQTGDPLSRKKDRTNVGTGGPGFTIPPEVHRKHLKGSIAAARLPDNINPSRLSNGSQFYICLAPMPSFDGQYTVFGNVIYGLDVLDALSTKPVDTNDFPVERIEVESIKIVPREALPPVQAPVKPGTPVKTKHWWEFYR